MTHTAHGLFDSPWFHLLASPIIWGLYFLMTYSLAEAACQVGFLDAPSVEGLSALSVAILGLTLVALLATLSVGLMAHRHWRMVTSRSTENEAARLETQAHRFMAVSGVWLSALFALTVLMTGLPSLVLSPCK